MPFSICIIDDGFDTPAFEAEIEHHSYLSIATIQLILTKDWGDEVQLQALCEFLVSERDETGSSCKWTLKGFSHPTRFTDVFETQDYRPNIVIFDWEYTTEVDQIAFLQNLVKKSHAQIYVFSGYDQQDNIQQQLADNAESLRGRVSLFPKNSDGVDNHEALTTEINRKIDDNFAFKFGGQLRSVVNKSLDRVLVELGRLNLNDVIEILSKSSETVLDNDAKTLLADKIKSELKEAEELSSWLKEKTGSAESASELIEIVAQKIQSDVLSSELTHTPTPDGHAIADREKVESELWSYRVFHQNTDGKVRAGDILKYEGSAHVRYFMVMTGPCDVAMFWKKTAGILSWIELHPLESPYAPIKENSNAVRTNAQNKNKFKVGLRKVSSLTNRVADIAGSPFYIPHVPNSGELLDFLVYPYGLTNLNVPPRSDVPSDTAKQSLLHYLTLSILRQLVIRLGHH